MNTSSKAKRILCYGDSNVWGQVPASEVERFNLTKRWTGRLQAELGDDYEVIEEGLPGRTVQTDNLKSGKGRNGLAYLYPCLLSHLPFDVFVVLLGTNDLKERFSLTAKEIADGLESYIKVVRECAKTYGLKTPEIVLMSPSKVDISNQEVEESFGELGEKQVILNNLLIELADMEKIFFIDLYNQVESSKEDGYHLDELGHEKVAILVAEKIINI